MSQSDDINDPRNPNSPFNLLNLNSPFYDPKRAVAQSGAGIVLGVISAIGVTFYWVFVLLPTWLLYQIFSLFFVEDTAIGCAIVVYAVVAGGLYIRFMWRVCRDERRVCRDVWTRWKDQKKKVKMNEV